MRNASALVLGLSLVATARPAHAMGAYHTPELVAWNADGTAALVVETVSTSGTVGTSRTYTLVVAGEPAIQAMFDSTLDPDQAQQHVTPAACRELARTFGDALRAHRFVGVTADPAACASGPRAVIRTSAAADRIAATSFATAPADPELRATLGADPVQVARGPGPLLIALYGENGDSSTPARWAALIQGRTGGYELR